MKLAIYADMPLISLLIVMCLTSSVLEACKLRKCHTTGYGCVPFNQCPPQYWAPRYGCGCGSVCCNLARMNACSLAGGTCAVQCQTRIRKLRECLTPASPAVILAFPGIAAPQAIGYLQVDAESDPFAATSDP
ncbi:uncharacterized protein [Dermacentor albipictus]|uniref:uncharacterized protein n=1 Tax=Dermacentor albipictus TaxID=60249 RepID=UPI0038FCF321